MTTKTKTPRLSQVQPMLGDKLMQGKPGNWYYKDDFSGEKTIVESWETPRGYRHGWRVMRDSTCLASGDAHENMGIKATASAAARWLAKRSGGYARIGVK